MYRNAFVFSLLCALGSVAQANEITDEDRDAFVINNLIHILYHEAGHAVIDQFRFPVLGQEEDAADAFATLEIMETFDDPLPILADAAVSLFILDERLGDDIEAADYYGTHDLDLQRAYRIICFGVGLDPENFLGLARDYEISPERLETCEDDSWLAADSWAMVLEPVLNDEGEISKRVTVQVDETTLSDNQQRLLIDSAVLDDFALYLSESFRWPQAVTITTEVCGEPNAFYDPQSVSVIMCAEFVDELVAMAAAL
ncbi:MAG: DUF4344 domain-containing metallopeptidase [Pseudomonadota bacterium]